jgi:MFS family permease
MFKPEDRAKAMGLHGAGGTLGHAMGPLSVSLLVGLLAWQWRQVYLFLAAPMVVGIFMVYKLPDYEEEKEETREEKIKGEKFLTTSLVMFLAYQATRMIASSMINTFLVLYLQDVRGMSLTISTFLQSTNTLTGLVFAPIGGYLAAKYGDKQWLQMSLLAAFTVLALAFQIPNNALFMGLYVLYGVGNTLGMAGRSAIMAKLTPSGQRGLGYALFFLPGSIIGAVAPFIAGYVADLMGFQTIFNVAVIVNFLALGILRFAVNVKEN